MRWMKLIYALTNDVNMHIPTRTLCENGYIRSRALRKNIVYVWFLENLRKNANKKKIERKKIKEYKNKFKFNKLFLYVFSNSFYLFLSTIIRLNTLKYINFKLILIIFKKIYIFIVKLNIKKPCFLIFYFFPLYFLETKHNPIDFLLIGVSISPLVR